jgi:hypothetical protein
MTAAQARWLAQNKPYRPLNVTAGASRYVKVGVLHEDGAFELKARGERPRITPGCFEVGVLEVPK